MKKITETQLKDKVNSLREYLKVYENQQVDEWGWSPSSWFNGRPMGDSTSRDDVRAQDAAKASTGGTNLALVQNREQLAPGSVASEQGKDGVTYAVDAKGMRTFKIENNKWVAMNPPTPTEQPELMAAPDPAPAAPSTQDLTAAASASGEAVGKSLQRFKELLAKAKGAAPSALPAGMTQAQVDQAQNRSEPVRETPPEAAPAAAAPASDPKASVAFGKGSAYAAAPAAAQSPYSLAGQGAKLKANESTTYFLNKLRLIESRQLNETLTDAEKKELDTLAQSFGDSEDPEIAGLLQQYSDVKNSAQAAAPAQAAAVTPAAPAKPTGLVTWKQIYDANKDVIGANPNLIKPGQQLKMPDGSTYTVKPGDNLSKIAKNASGGQAASVTPTAPKLKPPTTPTLTTAQQGFKDYGMAGQEMRSPEEIAASAGLADAPATPDEGLQPSDPRHSGHAAWKAQQAAADGVNQGIRPGANARDDLLARQNASVAFGKGNPAPAPQRKYGGYGQAVTTESVGYNELQRIVSLVNHR